MGGLDLQTAEVERGERLAPLTLQERKYLYEDFLRQVETHREKWE